MNMVNATEIAYKNGLTLLEAAKEYAPPYLRKRLAEIGLDDNELNFSSLVITPPLEDVAVSFSDSPFGRIDEVKALKQREKSELIKMLTAEKVLALGYQYPKALNPSLILIPSERWVTGIVDWIYSALHTDTESYSDIRIVPAPRLGDHDQVSRKQKRPGATSYREVIKNVYEELRDAGLIDFTRSFRANTPVIRDAAAKCVFPTKDGSEIRGFGPETIRKTVGEQFDQDKKTFKPDKPPKYSPNS